METAGEPSADAPGGTDPTVAEVATASAGRAAPRYLTLAGFTARHGFTTRTGGVSVGHYASLNLGLSSGDDPAAVEANRDRLLQLLGIEREQVCGYHQVHGTRVMQAAPGWFDEQADASVSDDPALLLVVSAADCFPVLFHDRRSGAVGAAHCGWRGTVDHLAGAVVIRMRQLFGTDPADLEVAIGQGIMGGCYQVSREVGERFLDAGFPASVLAPVGDRADLPGRERNPDGPLLDLLAAIRFDLAQSGVPTGNVTALARCTHCEPEVFYSHRRDDGLTGRMWGFVQAGPRVDRVVSR